MVESGILYTSHKNRIIGNFGVITGLEMEDTRVMHTFITPFNLHSFILCLIKTSELTITPKSKSITTCRCIRKIWPDGKFRDVVDGIV